MDGAFMNKKQNPADRNIPATIEAIETAIAYGNYYYDEPIFNAVHEFIRSDAPMEHKKRALRKLNECTGCDESCEEADVEAYIKAYNE